MNKEFNPTISNQTENFKTEPIIENQFIFEKL